MPKPPSAARRPGKRAVRTLLATLSKEQLIDELMRMYDDFAPVREYLSMRVSPDDTAVREKYKRIIAKEFSFSWTRTPRVSVARKAVQEYRKVASSAEGVADMMMFYVEQIEAFAADTGGDEGLFLSAWSMYHDAVDQIAKHELQDQFRERSRRLARSRHGYGFSDLVMDLHTTWFEEAGPEELEEEEELSGDA
ncbi:MAG TPA: DUF6155 family protein [Longimicrobium sp.]|jgi:hypothetical protein|nr:DUF6155 family protein [Longimicrobium sp.]